MAEDGTPVTVKPAAELVGKVFKATGARETKSKKFEGLQLKMQLEGGHVAYVGEKTGIYKGITGGKLKMPLNLTVERYYNAEGVGYGWTLAPKTA